MEKEKKECNCKTPSNKREENEAIVENIYASQGGVNLMRRFYILFLFLIYQFETTLTSSVSYIFTGVFNPMIDPILRSMIEMEEKNGKKL
jgi:hypothetical protein